MAAEDRKPLSGWLAFPLLALAESESEPRRRGAETVLRART
jgi:hypothetical protein